MNGLPHKSRHHLKVLESGVKTRKALVQIAHLLDDRRDVATGEPLSPEDLRLQAATAMTWLAEASKQFSTVQAQLTLEFEYRTREADPDVIHTRNLEDHIARLTRQPKLKRRKAAELAPEILRLHAEGLIPMAIADVLGTSDSTVRNILKTQEVQ